MLSHSAGKWPHSGANSPPAMRSTSSMANKRNRYKIEIAEHLFAGGVAARFAAHANGKRDHRAARQRQRQFRTTLRHSRAATAQRRPAPAPACSGKSAAAFRSRRPRPEASARRRARNRRRDKATAPRNAAASTGRRSGTEPAARSRRSGCRGPADHRRQRAGGAADDDILRRPAFEPDCVDHQHRTR